MHGSLLLKNNQKVLKKVKRFALFFLLFISTFLIANDTLEPGFDTLSSLQVEPDSIVGGHVNVLSGEFIAQDKDAYLMMQRPEPLVRTYCSGFKGDKTFQQQWSLNTKGRVNFQRGAYPIVEFKGQALSFHFNPQKEGSNKVYHLNCQMWDTGMTNTAEGFLSGRSNPNNYKLLLRADKENQKSDAYLHTPRGDAIRFQPTKKHHCLASETKEYGDRIVYDNIRDTGLVKTIRAYSKDGTLIDLCDILRENNKKNGYNSATVTTKSCKNKYFFSKNKLSTGDSRYLLEKVEREHAPNLFYKYSTVDGTEHEDGHLLSSIKAEGGNSLEICYYGYGRHPTPTGRRGKVGYDSPLLKRVHKLKALNCNNKPFDQFTFIYDIHQGITDTHVWNANGNLRVYSGRSKLLDSISDYKGSSLSHLSEKCSLYRSKKYFWGKERENPSKGHLASMGICRANKNFLFYKIFSYDHSGNVVQESLLGNFTGTEQREISVDNDGRVTTPFKDKLYIQYSYTQDGRNLALEARYPRYKKQYAYVQQHNKPVAEFIQADGKICKRSFFTYNNNNFLVEKVSDDGCRNQKENFEGVTERFIERFTPTSSYPFYLVKEHSFFFFDLETKKEVLLKKMVYSYNSKGCKTSEKIFDANGQFQGSYEYQYNAYGLETMCKNPLGAVTTKKYDAAGNLIAEEGPEPGYKKEIVYAANNLPLKVVEYLNGQEGLVKHLIYDKVGNLTQETDKYGNCVRYSYDEMGRKVSASYPDSFIAPNTFLPRVEKTEFDILDNPTTKWDFLGNATSSKYTAYGKPFFIRHPDGQEEHYTYSIEGFQLKHIDRLGLIHEQDVDWQGRPTLKRTYSPDRSLFKEHKFTYNTFHLLEEVDPLGIRTAYKYDKAGRLFSKETGEKTETFSYDSLGRVCEHSVCSSDNSIRTCRSYDILENLLEEKVFAKGDLLIKHVRYCYSPTGKKLTETHITGNGEETYATCYNCRGDVVKEIDPEGRMTTHLHEYGHVDTHGQFGHLITSILPSGKKLVSLKNHQEKEVLLEEYDFVGNLIKSTSTYYDPSGNKTRKIESHSVKDKTFKQQEVSWEYDSLGRLSSVFEHGTSQTKFSYNSKGQRTAVFLPDGRSVQYLYWVDGQVAESISSDGSADYSYTYDTFGRVVLAENKTNGMSTQRAYDKLGRLVFEKLENDLALRFEWNSFDKISSLTLPDLSKIVWQYSGDEIYCIKRLSAQGEVFYTHTYSSYDSAGRVLEMALAGDLGILQFAYDKLGRVVSQNSCYFSEETLSRDSLGNCTCIKTNDALGSYQEEYSYDALSQLTLEKGISNHCYEYDPFHNLLKKDSHATTLDDAYRVTNLADTSYNHNLNGCLEEIRSDKTFFLSYDVFNRLQEIEKDGVKTRYSYDAFGRRIKKSVGNSSELYLYLQQCEIGSYDESFSCCSLRLLGSGKGAEISAAIAFEIKGTCYVPFYDSAGNVRELVDLRSKKSAGTLRYTAFGEQITDCSLSPWTFSSKRFDPESGLIFFGKRYYLPSLGQWTTKDPLGDVDGLNFYSYVHNNPLNCFDLWGEQKLNFYWNKFKKEIILIATITLAILGSDSQDKFYFGYEGIYFENHFWKAPANTHRSAFGVLKGDVEDKQRFIFTINGICSDEKSCETFAKTVQGYAGGRDIGIVYNKSYGFFKDLFECVCNAFGFRTLPSQMLEVQIKKTLMEYPDAEILVIAHSQGCMHTRDALAALPKELQRRVSVLAIAPGGYINRDHCKNVEHLVCYLDPVTYVSLPGRQMAFKQGTVQTCLPIKGDIFCHFREAAIYSKDIKRTTEEFILGNN